MSNLILKVNFHEFNWLVFPSAEHKESRNSQGLVLAWFWANCTMSDVGNKKVILSGRMPPGAGSCKTVQI